MTELKSQPNPSILVVDDDPLARKVMAAQLQGQVVDFVGDLEAARKKLQEGSHQLCFIDLRLGENDDCSGLKLIPIAAAKGIYSVVMSGHDSEPMVEKAYELGCDDFYAKGNEQSNVQTILARFQEKRAGPDKERLFAERFITEDPATRSSINDALQYAASELPVLILGPSGTGKTSLARVIHDYSGRTGEFVAINCSAYAEDLLEAELFGFRKGAFTGANENRKGKLLLADRGTLFLDEIGSMSPKMQTKLLKAIEERSFYPLGSDKAENSRFRIVSATLEDVPYLIKTNKLRFDFFQRIHGLTLELKPLAERKCDILPLISFFTRGGRKLSFAAQAKELILRHDWPGNAREVKKFVDLLVAGPEGRVTAELAQKHFQAATLESRTRGFLTEEQYHFALSHGINEALDRFIDTAVTRCLAENNNKKTKVRDALKMGTRLLYTSLKRGGHPIRRKAHHEPERSPR